MRRVLSILTIICLLSSPALGAWSFVTLSDTYGGLENSLAQRTAQLYAQHDNIAFLVSTGDFVNNDDIDDHLMSNLAGYYPGYAEIPWFEALGNHNVDNLAGPDNVLDVLPTTRIQTQLPGMTNFRMGPHSADMAYAREGTTYSFDYGDAHFVIINQYYASDTDSDGVHDQGSPTACVYDQWYDWLAADLALNQKPLIFIVGHEPAFPRGSRHCGDSLDEGECMAEPPDWKNPARPLRDKFWALLNNHNVVAHFAGHEHTASARVIKDLADFPGIHRRGPDDYYCDDPHWNCYCIAEANLPEIADNDTVLPSQGVIEYNNGISRDNGDFHVIEVDDSTIRFYMYEDVSGTAQRVRTFSYDAAALMLEENSIFVDNGLVEECPDAYNRETRSCGGGTDTAYHTIAGGLQNSGEGVTVLLRSGTYNEVIRPQISGSPSAPVTIKSYNDETVTITNATYLEAKEWGDYENYRWGIYGWGVSHITIEGLVVDDPGHGWLRFVNSSHITIRNCEFRNATTSGDVAGLKFVNSHHNQILNNTIDDGFDNISLINSNFNLVQGNTVTKADHTLWVIKCGDYNIIRENHFYNEFQKIGEIYDCDDPANRDMGHFGITHVNATLHNIVEDNTFAGTAANDGGGPYNGIQLAGQHTIIRRNIFYKSEGTGIGLSYYAPEAEYDLHNRIYHNVFYDNAGGAVLTGRSQDADHFGDNRIENNIMLNNRVMPLGWADNLESGHQLSHRNMANFVVDHNCIFSDILSPDSAIYVGYDTRMGVTGTQSTYPSQYVDNLVSNPSFEAAASYNFRLQEGSLMIDAGKFLTTAVGMGDSSDTLVVADATYFSDGFGIQIGDLIQIQNQANHVTVTDINYATNTLTLSGDLSWSDGDGVSLKYAGQRPDMGAFEFGSGAADEQVPTVPSDPSTTAMSGTQISLTWTASTDNVAVDYYNVYRCEGDCSPTAVIGTTSQATYTDANLSPATQYTYQLSAVDTSGNQSGRCGVFTGTTQESDDPGSTDSDPGNSDKGSGCFMGSLN